MGIPSININSLKIFSSNLLQKTFNLGILNFNINALVSSLIELKALTNSNVSVSAEDGQIALTQEEQ